MNDKIKIIFREEQNTVKLNEIIRFNTGGVELKLDKETGVLQLLSKNGKVLSEVDFPTEKIITNAYYDEDNQELVLEFENAQAVRVPLSLNYLNIKNGEGESSLKMYVPEGKDYYPNTASGARSMAIGHNTTANGNNSFAEGSGTIANHYNTHAEGLETIAEQNNDHAEGAWTVAKGQNSHAEGCAYATGTTQDTIIQKTIASGFASHAEGQGTQASGTGAHSEGYLTVASQKASHAEGGETKATRGYAHAGGYGSEANGARSFVHGNYVKAEENDQFAIGTYNKNNPNSIFEVGNGTSESARKNAFEVLKDGRAKINGIPREDNDLVTKKFVDENFVKNTTNNLTNYYTKNEIYKKDEIHELLGNISSLKIEIVDELPTENISTSTIYLKLKQDSVSPNIYEEYVYINNSWEMIGTTDINLEDYVTFGDVLPIVLEEAEQTDEVETLEAELKYTIVDSEEYNEDSDLEIPTNKVVKEVVNKALKNSQTELKKYSLPLSEASWVRIAQVKDISKNASGTFTFDCYSIDYEGNKKLFTTSQFSVSCGVNEKGEIITDVLPISQTPELKGSSNENGSGGGSGDGSGGSGGTGVYGLASIKIERFKNNLYVCGLINYPAIELYSSLDVEMKIDNNLNYQYLDTLEVVNLDYTNREESSLLEGTVLKANQSYEVKIGVNLQKYINGVNYQYPINVDLFQDNETIFNFRYNPDVINKFLRYSTTNNATASADNYPFDLIDFSLAQNEITFEDLENAYSFYNSDLLKSIDNYICKIFRYGIGYTRFRKISGTIYFNTTVESTGLDIEINGETVYNLSDGEIGSYTFENLILDKDIVDIGYGTLYKPNQKVVIDIEKSEIEIVIPLTMEQDVTITTYSIQYNDVYDFKLKLNVVDEHETSNSYNLYSMYNKIDNVENYARLGYLYGAEYINDRPTLLKPEFTVNLYEYPAGRDAIRGIFIKLLGKFMYDVEYYMPVSFMNTIIYIDGADSYYYGYTGIAMLEYHLSARHNDEGIKVLSLDIEFQLLGDHKRYRWQTIDLSIPEYINDLDVPYKTLTMIDEEQYNSLLARIEALENK